MGHQDALKFCPVIDDWLLLNPAVHQPRYSQSVLKRSRTLPRENPRRE